MSENRRFEVMLDNHHIHLKQETIEKLFGEGYQLPQKKYLGGGEDICRGPRVPSRESA